MPKGKVKDRALTIQKKIALVAELRRQGFTDVPPAEAIASVRVYTVPTPFRNDFHVTIRTGRHTMHHFDFVRPFSLPV